MQFPANSYGDERGRWGIFLIWENPTDFSFLSSSEGVLRTMTTGINNPKL
jgi:hypothetical protein